ncbi:hypothetical protein Scep_017498 [Stephania cephalantha]|uniref:F-box domain-containing protein n=1 Tax=Stephania cephalantha TaxID=152367 RepID=A0AAP0IQ69_9MAGN
MEQQVPLPERSSSKSVFDLETDALTHCAKYLSVSDLSSFARTCKFFKSIAYSDTVWRHLFRKQWPELESSIVSSRASGDARAAYLDRHLAVQQFTFQENVFENQWSFSDSGAAWCILLDKNNVFLTMDSMVVKINYCSDGSHSVIYMRDHNASITCMRLFSAGKTSLFRNEAGLKDNFLVTSSLDHCIRLWWKGNCYHYFRHNGPVTAISDKLLGEDSSSSGNLIASGERDGTVSLWSLTSNIKQGQRALRTTFRGHKREIESLSVSGYNTSLLVSFSSDAEIKVWDTAASSSAYSSSCVGKFSFRNSLPLGVKCFESLCYVAAGTSITAIDLRTMQKAFCALACQPLYSFEVLPAKSLVCTGGYDKAMLWDVRRSGAKPEPVFEMEEHSGPVSSLHMDSYKIVTGSLKDSYCNVWDTSSGTFVNSLPVAIPHEPVVLSGCSAMAVSGSRIVTATCIDECAQVYLRDFNNATCSKPSNAGSQCTS